MSPIIVDRGNSEFKFIEDGRAKDAAANYTYVRAEDVPADLQYMLARDYDTTAPSRNAPSGGSSGGGGRNRGASTQASAAPRDTARPLPDMVDMAGRGDGTMTAQEIGPVSPGIPQFTNPYTGVNRMAVGPVSPGMPVVENPWLQFTMPEKPTVPQGAGPVGGARPQTQFGPEPTVNPLPIGRPTTGDLLQQRDGGYDPTAGQKYPYGSPMYNRSWAGEFAPPVSFANNQPQFAPPSQTVQPGGGYDFSTINSVLQGLQNGTIVLPGWR